MSRPPLDLSFTSKDHIVRAGAGAGKTFNLVECVVQAYRHFQTQGEEPAKKRPRFVLTTFTRKATQELRERMVLKACEMGDEDFFSFVTDPGHLMISTIHGVFGQFIKEFGHLHEMDLSFKILEGEEERLLLENAARELMTENPKNLEWLQDFSFSRLLTMLKSFHFHFGKNQNLQAPTVDEVWNHTLAFVEGKKVDFLQRVDEGLSFIEDPAYVKALHDMKEFLGLWDLDVELDLPSPPRKAKRESFPVEFHEEFLKEIKRFKDSFKEILLSKDELRGLSLRWEEFYDFAKEYSYLVEKHKAKTGSVTLGDLENQAHQILNKSPFLGKIFSQNFDFWLIDEFQDTSSHQLKILNQLIDDRPRFVVGDPQQSIYLFRGADSQIFSQEWDRISEQGGRTSLLEVNYRSQKDLLDFLNQTMAKSSQFSSMSAKDESASRGAVATFMEGEDLEDELRGICQRALDLCGESKKWDQICVLGRTHDDIFKVASYLKSKGIPTHVHSPSGYEERREIQDALSLYKFLVNPHDDLNLLQILRAPWLRVSDPELSAWMREKGKKISLWNFLHHQKASTHPVIKKLSEMTKKLDDLGLLRTFTDFLEDLQFIAKSSAFDPSGRVEANLWKLVHKMKELEKNPGSHPLDILFSLSQEADAVAAMEPNCVNLMTIHGSKGLEFDHVFFPRLGRRFQTSKRGGIAFSQESDRFVFSLKDDDDQALVSSLERQWIDSQKEKEKIEVQRWFYVALTRAKKTVTLSWNQSELYKDSWVDVFALKEIQGDKIDHQVGPFLEAESLVASDALHSPRNAFQSDTHPNLIRASFSLISAEDNTKWSHRALKNKFSAQAKGIQWHRLFEHLRFKDLDEGLNEFPFLRDMTHPPFKEILKNGHVEWGFQSRLSTRILEGQIDLWGYDQNQNLWVLDYKTGSSKEPEKAILQVKFYLWILRRMGMDTKNFCWAVIYPLHDKVVEGKMNQQDFEDLELKLGLSERAGQ